MAQLMPLPLIVSCFSKIQIGFTFLVQTHPGSLGQRAVKRVCVLAFKTEDDMYILLSAFHRYGVLEDCPLPQRNFEDKKSLAFASKLSSPNTSLAFHRSDNKDHEKLTRSLSPGLAGVQVCGTCRSLSPSASDQLLSSVPAQQPVRLCGSSIMVVFIYLFRSEQEIDKHH